MHSDALPGDLTRALAQHERRSYAQGYAAAMVRVETALLAGSLDLVATLVSSGRYVADSYDERRQRERDRSREVTGA